ncbi:MAG: hypothetical protein JSR72_22745 [Proteobacteria bacterium]|nr:hypothetical protein [Pseudomonadota bacterium]
MRPGLYKVSFETPLGAGAGAVYTDGTKLWGGDSGIYYVGEYSQDGDALKATVRADRHTQGLGSVFGKDRVRINLDGTVRGDTVTCRGSSPDAPGVQFSCTLTRISD